VYNQGTAISNSVLYHVVMFLYVGNGYRDGSSNEAIRIGDGSGGRALESKEISSK
jgi:hypothetical protein